MSIYEYRRLRALGFTAADALRSVRVNEAFEAAEATGAVKFEVVDDMEPYDDTYIDDPRYRKKLWNRIAVQGLYGIRTYALDPYRYTLEEVDTVWSFIGEDWKDSGYDVDLKLSALTALQQYIVEA